MVSEAEEFADADKKVKGKVDARNKLETYVYQIKSSVEDKLKGKVRRLPVMPAGFSCLTITEGNCHRSRVAHAQLCLRCCICIRRLSP